MKQSNFTGTQPNLFGENFGAKAKEKLEAATVLKKTIYPQPSQGKLGFSGRYPASTVGAEQQTNYYSPGKSRKAALNQKSLPDD